MMAELVGEHVGLGEVARRAESRAQLAEEAEVEVDGLIGRAVERAGGGRRHATATRVDRAVEEDELRILVSLPACGELLPPVLLHVVEDGADELLQLEVGIRNIPAAGGRRGSADVVERAAEAAVAAPEHVCRRGGSRR